MAWYRCEARGEMGTDGRSFAVTRFVEAEAAEAATRMVERCVARELVRLGVDPLDAGHRVAVSRVARVDEEEVPGFAPVMEFRAA